MRFTSFIAGAAALALAVLSGAAAHAQQTFKMAVTDVPGLERLQTEWGPFKAVLEKTSGFKFDFFAVNSRTAAVEALRAKRVDFIVTGPAEYVVINKLTDAKAVVGIGRPDYFCAVIVMNASPVLRLQDLKGKKIAFSDVGSTSGHLCPMQLLADYGVDPMKDIERLHVSRNVMHEALKRGDVAAIAFNHNSWISGARDKDKSVPPGAFRILARSGDLPNDLLMAGSHVDPAAVAKVRDSLVNNQAEMLTAILAHDENLKFKGGQIRAIEDKDYNIVRAMYATIGLPQYSQFVGE